ncbi:MAG: YcxB family protein [Thermoguttaceae bacterium]
MPILVACLVYLISVGGPSWLVAVFGTTLVLAVLLAGTLYLVNRHRELATLRRMAEPIATFDLSDTGMRIESDLGKGEVSWRAIAEIWTFPEAWLFFVAKGSYFTVSMNALSDDVQAFIRQRVAEHGGKIG